MKTLNIITCVVTAAFLTACNLTENKESKMIEESTSLLSINDIKSQVSSAYIENGTLLTKIHATRVIESRGVSNIWMVTENAEGECKLYVSLVTDSNSGGSPINVLLSNPIKPCTASLEKTQ